MISFFHFTREQMGWHQYLQGTTDFSEFTCKKALRNCPSLQTDWLPQKIRKEKQLSSCEKPIMDIWLQLLREGGKEGDRLLSSNQPLSESVGDSKRGINFLFSFHVSASDLNVTPNLKHGLSHPYQYSVPMHHGHIISTGYTKWQAPCCGGSFSSESKCEADVTR